MGPRDLWIRFWMQFAGRSPWGRLATRLAAAVAPPYKARTYLAHLNPRGYIDPTASIHHDAAYLGAHIFLADRVVIYQARGGGPVEVGDGVHIYRDSVLATGDGGSLVIGRTTTIQSRCEIMAYKGSISIGEGVQIGPNCAFYSYRHGLDPSRRIKGQPLHSKGGIRIDDDAWLGYGVIVLDGVRIGRGAVIGAGSVVTRDIPDGAIAFGVPARVVRTRSEADRKHSADVHHREVSIGPVAPGVDGPLQ